MDHHSPHPEAARAAEDHHSELWAGLTERAHRLQSAVVVPGPLTEAAAGAAGAAEPPARDAAEAAARDAAADLLDYLRAEVVPHLDAEREAVYPAARDAGHTALAAALELDHAGLHREVERLEQAATGLDAALAARGFLLLFALRMEKEEQVLLPALAQAGVDVDALLGGHGPLVGEAAAPQR